MGHNSLRLPVDIIRARSRDEALLRRVADLYAELDGENQKLGVSCSRCGACCDFASYGHRLFVTPIELSYLWAHVDRIPPVTGPPIVKCPYLVAERCSIHAVRLLGCRIFHCEFEKDGRLAQCYEFWHRRLVELHRASSLPYLYVEWGISLHQLGAS